MAYMSSEKHIGGIEPNGQWEPTSELKQGDWCWLNGKFCIARQTGGGIELINLNTAESWLPSDTTCVKVLSTRYRLVEI